MNRKLRCKTPLIGEKICLLSNLTNNNIHRVARVFICMMLKNTIFEYLLGNVRCRKCVCRGIFWITIKLVF